jgi:hypothetical protein
MRDISGQINDFSFASLSEGILEFGPAFEGLFLAKWQEQINSADTVVDASIRPLLARYKQAVPVANNVDGYRAPGREYSGATLLGSLGTIRIRPICRREPHLDLPFRSTR